MIKAKPTTKEQLVYYLLQTISLGTYDRRFLTNLQAIQNREKQPATSNQSALLDKITLRYAKQLRRQEIDANDMVKLPWHLEPIDSIPEYTDAFCFIKDNIIQIRSPYKKDFIDQIKNTKLHLTWDKETKIWSAPFCEATLKHFINCLDDHYHIVHYCPEIVGIINTMADYEEAKCWNPTYVKASGNYMIACINEPLAEALAGLTLDVEASTLARLTTAGVTISDEVKADLVEELWSTDEAYKLTDFATTHNPIISHDELTNLVNFLVDTKCDHVVIIESFTSNATKLVPVLIELLTNKNIPHTSVTRNNRLKSVDFSLYEYPVAINMALWGINQTGTRAGSAKTVFLGNNKPIDIK